MFVGICIACSSGLEQIEATYASSRRCIQGLNVLPLVHLNQVETMLLCTTQCICNLIDGLPFLMTVSRPL